MDINNFKSKISFENFNKLMIIISAFSTIATGYFAYTSYSLSKTLALSQLSPNFYIANSLKYELQTMYTTESISIKNLNPTSSFFNYTSKAELYIIAHKNGRYLTIPVQNYFLGKSNSNKDIAEIYFGYPANHFLINDFYNYATENFNKYHLDILWKNFIIITYKDSFNNYNSLYYDIVNSQFVNQSDYTQFSNLKRFSINIEDFINPSSYEVTLNKINSFF